MSVLQAPRWPYLWLTIAAFLLWVLLTALDMSANAQSTFERSVQISKIEREGTKPTGDIVFWHLLGSGGTCSADAQSPLGEVLRSFEHYPQGREITITLTLHPERQLQKIVR